MGTFLTDWIRPPQFHKDLYILCHGTDLHRTVSHLLAVYKAFLQFSAGVRSSEDHRIAMLFFFASDWCIKNVYSCSQVAGMITAVPSLDLTSPYIPGQTEYHTPFSFHQNSLHCFDCK